MWCTGQGLTPERQEVNVIVSAFCPCGETWEWSSNPHSLSSSTSSQSPGLVVKYFSSLIPSLFASLLANFVLYNSVRPLPRKSLPSPPISTLFSIHLQDGVVCVCNLSPSLGYDVPLTAPQAGKLWRISRPPS